jgi:heterotetrameric sarcosine oxidase delta subunit
MQVFDCPFCGPRPETEFVYVRALESIAALPDAREQLAHLYTRENPRGPHRELWQHIYGCRSWFAITRDTVSHAVLDIGYAGRMIATP